MDDEKPSTKQFVLKQKDIIPIDQPARPGDGTALSVQLIHKMNQVAEEKGRRALKEHEDLRKAPPIVSSVTPHVLKTKDIDPIDKAAHAGDEEAILVPDLLLENRVAEEESGYRAVKPRKRRVSRRNRDFFLILVPVDAAIIAFMIKYFTVVIFAFGLGALALITSMMTWIMFMVMDDY